jgi:PAS domain S-box-containing protein
MPDLPGAPQSKEDTAQTMQRLRALQRMTIAIASNLDLSQIVQTVTDAATELTGARFGAFFYNIVNADGEAFQLFTLSGAPREAFERFGLPRKTAVFAPTFDGVGPIRSDDIRTDPRYGLSPLHFGMPEGHLPVVSYLAVPVISRTGAVLGGLFFGHETPAVFTQDSQETAEIIAAHAAIAIDNAEILGRAQREAETIRKAQETSAWLAAIVESSEDAIISKTLTGIITSWNRGAEQLFGYTAEEAIGQSISLLIPEDRLQEEAMILHRIRRGERTQHYETIRRRKDGRLIDVSLTTSPIRDTDGRVVGASKIARDITQQRRLAERQRLLADLSDRFSYIDEPSDMSFAAAEMLGRTFGVSRAGYGTVDLRAETITIERDWNAPGITTLAGVLNFRDYGSYIEDLKRGKTVVFADAREDPRTAANADALAAISALSVVNMPVTEQGDIVALLYLNNAAARIWTDDEILFLRDVATRVRAAVQRRRAEKELQLLAATLERQVSERTAELNQVWRNSRDLLAVIDADGVYRAVNPAWQVILGYEPSQIVGRNFAEFVWPEDIDRSRATHETAVQQNLTNFENRFRHQDGTPRWISWQTTLEDGLIYAYGRHITAEKENLKALRRTEEQLRQAQKMEAVGQLTGGIAHDFNNLLTGIIGSLDILNIRIAQAKFDQLERYIATAQAASKRAAALTHRLLAFSRRQTLDPKTANINRLIGGMEELIRRTVGPQITVETVAATGLWNVFADVHQIENSLLNLCINARDAMPDGGRLTIETANRWLDERAARDRDLPPGQYVTLCVSDTGTGMTPDVIARAFDPFFTTKPLGVGTGLGLSMIYGFAQQSGGQVRIYSEVGQGTMVCLYLPRHSGEEDADEALAAPATAPNAPQGETVLVVDDEPSIRMLICEVLSDAGYHAIEADDGPSSLKILVSETRIDLLITDIGLPGGMNGRQIAEAARAHRPDLKVLFITGYAENAVIGNGLLPPGMQVLTKPFAMKDLARRINDAIKQEPAL